MFKMDPPPAGDIPYSYSRPDLVAVTDTRLELSVNFDRKVLEGKAILTIEKKASTCNELVLDTYGLEISRITYYSTREILTPTFGNHDINFGRKLTITLPNVGSADHTGPTSSKRMKFTDSHKIKIIYKTRPESPALYWLEPHQTSDRTHPLLISNSKLTYARAIFPCQDTPSNRFTFHSTIIVPKGFNVMMPGTRQLYPAVDKNKYVFYDKLNVPMAPYDIYIIVGSLINLQRHYKAAHMNLDIWTEETYRQRCTEFLDKIADILYEIKESYNFLGDVNICVLPPNVPEFDMQYPYMTFVSSSLLEGQYSIIDTIVQNVIESWIRRTVVIDNFKHLWLIKGLSTFIYRNPINDTIIDKEEKFRNAFADQKTKSRNNLLSMPQLYTVSLVPAFTSELLPMNIIKYVSEKGCVFLNHLQDLLGSEFFKSFLVHGLLPLDRENCGILTSDRFKTLLYAYFSILDTQGTHKISILNAGVDWDKWFNEPRFPASHPYTMFIIKTHWEGQAEQWIAQETASFDTIGNFDQSNDLGIIEFLTYLLSLPNTVLPDDKLRMIKRAFLSDQENCEIRFLWLRLCIKSKWLDDGRIREEALRFACEYCMPKYACPIFRDLYNLGETRELAISCFRNPENRSKMLRETINELSSILKVELNG